jgi:glycosyl transferase family 25
MKKWKVFILNLERSTDRYQKCSLQLQKQGIEFERIDAVDGRNINEAVLAKLRCHDYSKYHKPLTNGELGCYLTHLNVYREIINQQLDFALVLEDDVLIDTQLKDTLESLSDNSLNLPPWDLIKLSEYPIKRKALLTKAFGFFDLIVYNKIPARTCGQLVSKSGAEKILINASEARRPIDIQIQHWWEMKLIVFGLKPYLIEPDLSYQSDIDDDQTERKKVPKNYLKLLTTRLSFLFLSKTKNTKLIRLLRNDIQ